MKKKLLFSLLFASIITFISISGMLHSEKEKYNDLLYQETSISNPNICIIGIDAESIDKLGSFPFDRTIFAEVINLLNEQENPPIAIGIDVLFTGETNEESDLALVNSLKKWDNVILATSANYGTALVLGDDGDFALSSHHLLSMNYPFPALLAEATLGHINSSLDNDGILRHSVLTIENENGETISSLSLNMYEKYCESQGISVGTLPENSWYVPFTSKSGGYYDGYSLSKVFSGEIPPSVFADKMVFIGPYAIGLQDHFYTAIDHNNLMYGVEYQANALETLIKQDFVSIIGAVYKNVFLFISLFVLFYVTIHKKLFHSGIILLLTSIIYIFVCKSLYQYGFLTDVFFLPFGCLSLFFIHIIVNAVTENLEKAKVTATFKRYVAPGVVEQIFKEGVDNLQLGGSLTDVSVMFVDVRNFTPMSEKFPPEIVVDILNQLLDSMAETIMKNGGTLDKFIGDAIMCFWGAPLPQEDYIYRSVKTAVEISENVKIITEKIEKQYNHTVTVGIGIQCGKAVVGNIGSHNRMDFTVIGDTVNTAARLESNAKGGVNVINISHDVYEKVSDFFEVQEIEGGLTLKGKEGIFRAYQVLGEKSHNTP